VDRLVLPENPLNGGLPEPPAGEAIRVIAAHHDACGVATRVRLPDILSPRAVRRFHCSGCAASFEARQVEEIDERIAAPAPPKPKPVAESGPAELSLEQFVQAARTTVPTPDAAPAEVAVEAPPSAPAPLAIEPETPAAAPSTPSSKRSLPKLGLPKFLKTEISMPKLSRSESAKPKPAAAASTPASKRSLPKLALPKFLKTEISLPKLSKPTLAKPRLPSLNPESRSWKLISLPIAAILVIVALLLLRGGGDASSPAASTAGGSAAVADGKKRDGKSDSKDDASKPSKPSKDTEFVRESSYSLAMPAGWQRIEPPAGATFAAVAADGSADATLWITKDQKLDFATFTAQSQAQLEALAGSAQVVESTTGPTIESNVVRLAADAPAGQPSYEVTLRAAGPYRYYLATSVESGAPAEVTEAAELVAGSLTPELEQ